MFIASLEQREKKVSASSRKTIMTIEIIIVLLGADHTVVGDRLYRKNG